MNELVIPTEFQESFPTLTEGLRRAWSVFDSVRSFADIERLFLKGECQSLLKEMPFNLNS